MKNQTFTQIGTSVGKLVQEKNAAYGSSFAKSGEFLRLLFPNGIAADRFEDALLLVRIFDKQMRIATDKDAFGESPYQDIAGYGVLGIHLHQQKKESQQLCPGSASDPIVEKPSKAQPDSAEAITNEMTTTSESETTAPAPSQPPASSSDQSRAATAPTAAAHANESEADRLLKLVQSIEQTPDAWLQRNREVLCSACGIALPSWGRRRMPVLVGEGLSAMTYLVCSKGCSSHLGALSRMKEVLQ